MFQFFDNLLANTKSNWGQVALCALFSGIFVTATIVGGLLQGELNHPASWILALTLTFFGGAGAGAVGALILMWLEGPPSSWTPRWATVTFAFLGRVFIWLFLGVALLSMVCGMLMGFGAFAR